MGINQSMKKKIDKIMNRPEELASGILVQSRKMPVCLCVDTSFSMLKRTETGKVRADLLSKGINNLIKDLHNGLDFVGCELCVLAYNGDGLRILHNGAFEAAGAKPGEDDFVPIKQLTKETELKDFHGESPMFAAVDRALDELENQFKNYKSQNIPYDRGWLILLSDGQASDAGKDRVRQIALQKRFKKLERSIRVICGCFGYHYDNLKALTERSLIKNMEEFNEISEYIRSLSRSIREQSRARVPMADEEF